MDGDGSDCKQESSTIGSESVMSESLKELRDLIVDDFQPVQIHWEDIFKVASRAKKSTGGGLYQLRSWHLKSTILNSHGNRCAKVLAQWANRWAGGAFYTKLGIVLAMSRLMPIYKDWSIDDVRPVACGSSIRTNGEGTS